MYSETLLLNALVEIFDQPDLLSYVSLLLETRERADRFVELKGSTITARTDGPWIEYVEIKSDTLPGRINLWPIGDDDNLYPVPKPGDKVWWSVDGMGYDKLYNPENRSTRTVDEALTCAIIHMMD